MHGWLDSEHQLIWQLWMCPLTTVHALIALLQLYIDCVAAACIASAQRIKDLPASCLIPPALLAACPQLHHLTLVDCSASKSAPRQQRATGTSGGTAAADTHLHTLVLRAHNQLWAPEPATGLSSLTALHTLLLTGDDAGLSDAACQSIAVVATQLTRLSLDCRAVDDDQPILQPLMQHCVPGLSQRLQRLELPRATLYDHEFLALCEQLPELDVVEVRCLRLQDNHADVPCNWQQLVINSLAIVEDLARLPLARAGRHGGLQKVAMTMFSCGGMIPAPLPLFNSSVATVRDSTCHLTPVLASSGVGRLFLVCSSAAGLQALAPLLRRFEPDSIARLGVWQHNIDNDDESLRVQALTALLAEVAAGHAALNSCTQLFFVDNQWFTPAACSALLPALMPSKVKILALQGFHPDAAAAVCSPESLAAVTRPLIIGVDGEIDVAAVRAAIAAAAKGHFVDVQRLSPEPSS
jgi:hypothetical protein